MNQYKTSLIKAYLSLGRSITFAVLLIAISSPLSAHEFLDPLPKQQQLALSLQQSLIHSQLKHSEKIQTQKVSQFIQTHAIPKKKESGIKLMKIYNQEPIYYITHNKDTAIKSSVDKVWPGGEVGSNLDGSGQIIGIWDAGPVLSTHQEFGNRVSIIDTTYSSDNHATHVAGTMIAAGVDAQAKGIAYNASLYSYDWDNALTEVNTSAQNGLLVTNHSWGFAIGWYLDNNSWYWYGNTSIDQDEDYKFGFYLNESQSFDQIVYSNPYTVIVKAAGNDRNDIGASGQTHRHSDNTIHTDTHHTDFFDGGYDTIDGSSVAKNIITVGAIKKDPVQHYQSTANVVMSSFTGWGPADDGRIKPDIVAKGHNTYSPIANGNTSYNTASGTSMASPAITGMVALIQDHQQTLYGSVKMLASTIKGLLIHTADEAGIADGPDYQFGWGLANLSSAITLMRKNKNATNHPLIYERILEPGAVITIPLKQYSGQNPIKITICWTDPAGTPPNNSLDPSTKMIVHDIDSRLINNESPNTLYFPWVLNPSDPSAPAQHGDNSIDTVEQLYFRDLNNGSYSLQISHKGTLQAAQNVSIIINDYEDGLSSSSSSSTSELVTQFVTGPNPLRANEPITFQYTLAQDSDIYLCVYTISGHKLFEHTSNSGQVGASTGMNKVSWDGNSINGKPIINGVYIAYLVVKSGARRSVKKFKIAVVK